MTLIVIDKEALDKVLKENIETKRSRDEVVKKYKALSAEKSRLEDSLEQGLEYTSELEEELHQNAIELQHYKELAQTYKSLLDKFTEDFRK